jgi:Mrp family chromosome partitioning ATPase
MSKNFALLRKAGKEQDLFKTSDSPRAVVGTIDCERTPAKEIVTHSGWHPEVQPQNPSLQVRCLDVIEEKIRSVGREIPRKVARKAKQESDLASIRYREEVKLVQRIFPLNAQGSPQLVLFASLEKEGDACSISARTCEILAARTDGPVCVVDANFRSPFLHRYFGVENHRGFSDAIYEPSPAQDFTLHVAKTNLWVMPSGSAAVQLSLPQLSEAVSSRMMELRTLFKYVVINSPLYLDRLPALPSFAADGIVLVVEANSTRRETVREVMEELQIVGTRVLGVILNNRTFPIPNAVYNKL